MRSFALFAAILLPACGGGSGASQKLCQSCAIDRDCDPGGMCLSDGNGGARFCGIDCRDDPAVCPDGYFCFDVADGSGGSVGRQCAPLGGAACADLTTDASVSGGTDEAFCVDETNRYRAMVSEPPLARSAALEAYAAEGAEIDGTAHQAHKHFQDTNGGGIAFAENEIPWWPLSDFGSVREIVRAGLALMWAEGPGGGHYEIIRGPYTALGCGIFVNGDEVTVVQDYQ